MKKIIVIVFLLIVFAGVQLNADEYGYVFGSGDVVKIDFIGARYMTATYTIDNYGEIKLPAFGKYKIAQKSIEFVKNELTALYKKQLQNPEIDVILVKSYKTEQSEQNRIFLEKIETVKHIYFLRDYAAAINETLNLLNIIVKTSGRDSDVFGAPAFDLEILNFNFSIKNNMYEITGKLRNNASIKYNWVKCKFEFLSAAGKTLAEREHYIVRDIPVYQTQIVPFEFKGFAHKEAVSIKMKIIDYLIEN